MHGQRPEVREINMLVEQLKIKLYLIRRKL